MQTIRKIMKALIVECSNRGVYFTLIMNISHVMGVLRGLFFRILFFRNINASIYSLQSNSKIEIFCKDAKLKLGKFVFIRKNASIRLDTNGVLDIEDYVFINDNCNINCINKIVIGQNTKIAPNVCINDHDHNYKNKGDQHLLSGEVHIGKNVWIGSHVVILKDTTIGDNSVIAAGSVVKGYVPANTLYVNKRESKLISFLPEHQTSEKVVSS
jgi:acetyltransferase-like isoleucine patch superfamily enzyme